MTNPATLLALADRCEQAAGPDRELDNAILSALGYSWRGMAYCHNDDNHVLKGSTFFTKILDAAVTLVPEGWTWARYYSGAAECGTLNGPGGSILFERGQGISTALSLCAAALRARAAMAQPSSDT
jgi:hypothetical protein